MHLDATFFALVALLIFFGIVIYVGAFRKIGDGLDISVQTYKAGCPPSALTKLPLIAGYEVVDFILSRMGKALSEI